MFSTIFKKFDCRNIRISWKIYKKGEKSVEFFHMWFLFLKLEPSIFAFAKKPTFDVQFLNRQVQGR